MIEATSDSAQICPLNPLVRGQAPADRTRADNGQNRPSAAACLSFCPFGARGQTHNPGRPSAPHPWVWTGGQGWVEPLAFGHGE